MRNSPRRLNGIYAGLEIRGQIPRVDEVDNDLIEFVNFSCINLHVNLLDTDKNEMRGPIRLISSLLSLHDFHAT